MTLIVFLKTLDMPATTVVNRIYYDISRTEKIYQVKCNPNMLVDDSWQLERYRHIQEEIKLQKKINTLNIHLYISHIRNIILYLAKAKSTCIVGLFFFQLLNNVLNIGKDTIYYIFYRFGKNQCLNSSKIKNLSTYSLKSLRTY